MLSIMVGAFLVLLGLVVLVVAELAAASASRGVSLRERLIPLAIGLILIVLGYALIIG